MGYYLGVDRRETAPRNGGDENTAVFVVAMAMTLRANVDSNKMTTLEHSCYVGVRDYKEHWIRALKIGEKRKQQQVGDRCETSLEDVVQWSLRCVVQKMNGGGGGNDDVEDANGGCQSSGGKGIVFANRLNFQEWVLSVIPGETSTERKYRDIIAVKRSSRWEEDKVGLFALTRFEKGDVITMLGCNETVDSVQSQEEEGLLMGRCPPLYYGASSGFVRGKAEENQGSKIGVRILFENCDSP